MTARDLFASLADDLDSPGPPASPVAVEGVAAPVVVAAPPVSPVPATESGNPSRLTGRTITLTRPYQILSGETYSTGSRFMVMREWQDGHGRPHLEIRSLKNGRRLGCFPVEGGRFEVVE